MRFNLAISPCPNDVFIFAGLIAGKSETGGLGFDIEYHELETLNVGARAGRWDAAKISYANAAGLDGYRLLRCGGALGRGCGPLLLSNRPSEGGDGAFRPGAEVLVPGARTTANFLLDFWHRNADATGSQLTKAYLPFDALYRRLLGPEPCQGVVIHEMRFTYSRDGLFLVRDLGAAWESATGHPIPLGAVALKRSLEPAAAAVESAIRASLDWSRAHPDEALALCRLHSQSLDEAVLRSHIDLYVNAFSGIWARKGNWPLPISSPCSRVRRHSEMAPGPVPSTAL